MGKAGPPPSIGTPQSDTERLVRQVNNGFKQQANVIDGLSRRLGDVESRLQLEATKELMREQYRQAHGYSNIVVGAGYVGFFAIWAFVKDLMSPTAHAAAALFIGISLAVYVLHEVIQMVSAALAARELEQEMSQLERPLTIEALQEIALRDGSRRAMLWPAILATTLVTAGLGLLFLLVPLVTRVASAL